MPYVYTKLKSIKLQNNELDLAYHVLRELVLEQRVRAVPALSHADAVPMQNSEIAANRAES